MSLINDFNNMLNDIKKNTKSPEFKKTLIKKYNKLYNSSEKLFDKLYSEDCNANDIQIIKTMLNMKSQKDCGNIDKLDADKKIGETLCDIYVKPMLNKNKNNNDNNDNNDNTK